MNKMMQWVLAATVMICGASVFVACSKNDNPVAPQDKPLPKVSKIYSSSVVKAERKVDGQWTTINEQVNERALVYDFQWTGDRLESIQTTERSMVLTYDDNQHIINARLNGTRLNYAYEYDAQGRLARMVETMPFDDTIDHIYYTTFSYNGDKLVKTEETNEFSKEKEPNPTSSAKEVTNYEWQGDNVVSKTVEKDLYNGSHTTENYSYEYTTLLNPFYNDILLLTGVYSVGGFKNDGSVISKNLPKNVVLGSTVYYYEYTIVGDRVVSIITDNTVETSVMRATTHSVYDLEYAE
jgi:YD repeat-containing protein